MQFLLNVLILESDDSKRQTLETIFSFLGAATQSGQVEDCLSYLDSCHENVDVCVVGNIQGSSTLDELIVKYNTAAFITTDSSFKIKNEAANFIGTLAAQPSYDELVSLLHYSQSFRAMRKYSLKTGHSNTLIKLLVGKGPAITLVRRLIEQVAKSEANVLILGESGTGKEVVARAIHETSDRSNKPFVPVNCGAIPAELLESELFGHEKGAFTGAFNSRQGRFEMAQGGTLFLDEIGDMPLQMQVKLLRVLQERKFERVGSNKTIEADVRILAATHQNLEQMVAEHKFREDLFYRLNVFPIETPPLRNRTDDIPLLIQELVNRHAKDQKGAIRFTQGAMQTLMQNEWKGNVRELSNLVERLLILHPNEIVDVSDLPPKYRGINNIDDPNAERDALLEAFSAMDFASDDHMLSFDDDIQSAPVIPDLPVIEGEDDMARAFEPTLTKEGVNLKDMVSNIEISMIKQALEQSGGVVAKASEILGLRRTTLVEKMKKYGISAQ